MKRREFLARSSVAAIGTTAVASVGIAALPDPRAVYWRVKCAIEVLTGKRVLVRSGEDLDIALTAARPGQIVALEPGGVYAGPLRIPHGAHHLRVTTNGIPDLVRKKMTYEESSAQWKPDIELARISTADGPYVVSGAGMRFVTVDHLCFDRGSAAAAT